MSLSMEQTVVLTEDGHLELTPISQNCVLHAVEVLAPTQATSLLLPSGAYKIEQFSKSLVDVIKHKAPRKRTDTLSLADDSLLPSIDISKFYEGAMSTTDFAKKIENKLVDLSQGSFDVDSLHRACWKVYDFDKKSAISHPKWLSPECTYRLWLIYNCVLEKNTGTTIRIRTANEVLKRIVELCGYTWNGSYQMSDKTTLDFPEYLDSITRYFTYLKLETSLTCEVILDMVDEIVHGVLRKGYLIKKGHKRKNWKKRWFVLQRTVLKYFESMEKPIFKGHMMLNSKTKVESLPDKKKVKFLFRVTCGSSGTPFEISAETQRCKNEWMLAIKKAIALAKVLDGSSKSDDFEESLAGFYLVKYGTSQPDLPRQDSDVRQMKYQATMKSQRQRLSGRNRVPGSHTGIPEEEEAAEERDQQDSDAEPQEEYMRMQPCYEDISSDDSEDDDGYLEMQPIRQQKLSESYEGVDDHVLDASVLPLVTSSSSSSSSSAPIPTTGQLRKNSTEDIERSIKVRLSQLGNLPPLSNRSDSDPDLPLLLSPSSRNKPGGNHLQQQQQQQQQSGGNSLHSRGSPLQQSGGFPPPPITERRDSPADEEDSSDSEQEEYTVMDPDLPRYVVRPKETTGYVARPREEEEDEQYIDMLREQKRQQAEDSGRGSLGLDDCMSREDAEVSQLLWGRGGGKPNSLSVTLDGPPRRSASPNAYLTVLRSPPSPPSTPHTFTAVRDTPPIPPHRRSPSPRRHSAGKLLEDETTPPPPPPRTQTLLLKGQHTVSSPMVASSLPSRPSNPSNRLSQSEQFRKGEFVDRRKVNRTVSNDSGAKITSPRAPPLPPR